MSKPCAGHKFGTWLLLRAEITIVAQGVEYRE